jgi:hypothetical protein
MPAALRYGRIDSPEWTAAEQSFKAESIARASAAALAWQYYDGKHPKSLKEDRTKIDDNIIVNLIGLIVDKAVSGLFGTTDSEVDAGVKFDIIDKPGEPGFVEKIATGLRSLFGGQQNVTSVPSQDYLDGLWRANKKNILLHDVGFFGSLLGHVFVKLVPNGAVDPETGLSYTRLINLDPASVTVYWDGNDYDRVLWYRVQYDVGNVRVRQDIVRNLNESGGDANSWSIYNYQQELSGSSLSYSAWQLTGKEEEWPYPFAPIVDWKNLPRPKSYYGMDDVSQNAMGLNKAINFVYSTISRILKHHATPKTVGTGFKADQLEATSVDSLWTVEEAQAKIYNLELTSDLASSLNFAATLRAALFDSAREADPESIRSKLGQLSNFDLRVLFQDVLAKAGTKRLLYGDGLVRLNRCLLALGGHDPHLKMSVEWPEPLPSNPVEQAQALQIDVATGGLSKETYLEKRGYSVEQEAQRRETEAFEASMHQPAVDPLAELRASAAAPAGTQPATAPVRGGMNAN